MSTQLMNVNKKLDLVDAHAIGEVVGLSGLTILKYARAGLIPSIKISRKVVRFDLEKVIAALRSIEHA